MPSINQHTNQLGTGAGSEMQKLLSAHLADITALRATVAALVTDIGVLRTAFNTAMTKLNADAGVTDVNYAAAAALTVTAPSALTVTA